MRKEVQEELAAIGKRIPQEWLEHLYHFVPDPIAKRINNNIIFYSLINGGKEFETILMNGNLPEKKRVINKRVQKMINDFVETETQKVIEKYPNDASKDKDEYVKFLEGKGLAKIMK